MAEAIRIDARLAAVARQIHCEVHADIGSDHGNLLRYLLASGRIGRGIAVENKRAPFENSRQKLRGLQADVRFGDGLAVLRTGEVQSLSICGMGAAAMVKILEAFPERLPERIVIQPNRQPELLRRWAQRSHFHLEDEELVQGHWPFWVMTFHRAQGHDPAYRGLDLLAAELFGPLLLRRADHVLIAELQQQQAYLRELPAPHTSQLKRLRLIETQLEQLGQSG